LGLSQRNRRLIGDGDHGVNMAKGFRLAAEPLRGQTQLLSKSLSMLGDVLMTPRAKKVATARSISSPGSGARAGSGALAWRS
jgi:hypothetical protein